MSLEAIKAISDAEEAARRIKTNAAGEAKKLLESAEAEGISAIEAAEKRAVAELRELQKKADEKVTEEVHKLASASENKKAALRARAEARLDSAALLVAERIVSS